MSFIDDIPKPVWFLFVFVIVVFVMIANGTFSTTAKSVVDSEQSVIEAGKTMCKVKDIVLRELLDVVYDEAPEQAKKILDKFKTGEKLTECDYLELYNSLEKKYVKNWTFDAACNALVCSGI